MPELPEVETVVTILKNKICKKKIVEVKVHLAKIIKNVTPIYFEQALIGEVINSIKRRGKHLLFLTDNYCFISHLRMEGKFYIYDNSSNYDKYHVLLSFFLSDNTKLVYHDTRRFGTFHLHSLKEYHEGKLLSQIGLEPFDPKITAKYLHNSWKNRKKEIKSVLLEQNIICGIGNIYACEALYDAKINPFIATNTLTKKQLNTLIRSIRKILTKAIQAGGTTVSSFHASGISGKFQHELKVYGRAGKKCYSCGSIIQKRKLSGRGTYFCTKEQNVNYIK